MNNRFRVVNKPSNLAGKQNQQNGVAVRRIGVREALDYKQPAGVNGRATSPAPQPRRDVAPSRSNPLPIDHLRSAEGRASIAPCSPSPAALTPNAPIACTSSTVTFRLARSRSSRACPVHVKQWRWDVGFYPIADVAEEISRWEHKAVFEPCKWGSIETRKKHLRRQTVGHPTGTIIVGIDALRDETIKHVGAETTLHVPVCKHEKR